jgi:PAS domain S-box-containing protein
MNTTFFVLEPKQAKQALEEVEQKYARLLGSVTDYVYTVTVAEGRPVTTSHGPGCEAVTGYTPEQFQADPFLWYRMIYADDRAVVSAQAERILHCQTPPPLEHRIVHKDGRVRWIRNTPVLHKDVRGRLVAYNGLISDITERKAVEEQQRLSEARLQAILDHSPAVIHLKDVEGHYILINRRFEQLFHLTRESIVGKLPRDIFPEGTASTLRNHDQKVLATLTPLEFEETLPLDGEPRTYISVKFPLLDTACRPYALCGISTDITERKRAEIALRQSQERLALVIQGSSDGVWDWDLTTNQVYFSTRWKSMLGYAEDEVESHFSGWERLLHPEDGERAHACLQAYLSGQTPTYELEHRLRHKDGSYRWILARGVALRDAQGKPVRMSGSHVDLTARKEAEERLRRAYEELSQNEIALKSALQGLQTANEELKTTQLQLIQAAKMESVGTLAAGVAHEVKNPLQTILMGLDYLVRNLPAGNGNTTLVLNDMRDAVTRANTIVRELLQLSAATDFQLRAVDLNAVVDRALRLIQSELIASQVTVVRQLAAGLPPVRLDCNKMEQVFINLFINALQAMSPHGVLTVTTRDCHFGEELKLAGPAFAQFKPGEPLVVAEVHDTGTGIPEALLPKIFDPFFTTKPSGVGTGLGLSVAKKIMDFHGAAIHIRNHPLGGVVATLLFRAEPEERLRPKTNLPERAGGVMSAARRGQT